jgi:hypothetical protein
MKVTYQFRLRKYLQVMRANEIAKKRQKARANLAEWGTLTKPPQHTQERKIAEPEAT